MIETLRALNEQGYRQFTLSASFDPEVKRRFLTRLLAPVADFLTIECVGHGAFLHDTTKEGKLLLENPTDVVIMGIGENGHIAFNDPSVADFKDNNIIGYEAGSNYYTLSIAKWFDNKKENLDHITDLDSPVEYMLFKYAAGTGWDCPRAHVLVMYREIQSDTFRTQTLGRILRNPVPNTDLSGYPSLRVGYLYTNYRRNEVQNPRTIGENRPRTQISQLNIQPKIQFATETFGEEVGRKLKQTLGFKYEDTTKIKNLLAQIVPAAKTASEAIAQVVVTENNLQNQQDKIQQHAQKLAQQVEQQVGDLFAGYADVINAPQVTTEILDYVNKLTATAAGRRDQDLIIDPILKSDFLPRGDYGDVGRVSDFQSSFVQSMNTFFHVPETLLDINGQKELLRRWHQDLLAG